MELIEVKNNLIYTLGCQFYFTIKTLLSPLDFKNSALISSN